MPHRRGLRLQQSRDDKRDEEKEGAAPGGVRKPGEAAHYRPSCRAARMRFASASSRSGSRSASERLASATTARSTEPSKNVSTNVRIAVFRARSAGTAGRYRYRGPSTSWVRCPLSRSLPSIALTAEYVGGFGSASSTSETEARPSR